MFPSSFDLPAAHIIVLSLALPSYFKPLEGPACMSGSQSASEPLAIRR
jgi:hypothetical protein